MPPSRPIADRDSKKARVLANRYEIVRKLGSGNFGTAFLCRDVKSNNQLKVLKEIPVDLKPDETVDANQEAKLLSKLDHPGIVKFFDSFVDGDFFCIVTEYCEGGDLALKIEEFKKAGQSFSEKTVLDWTIQLLLAADYIHSRRVLHRDLKSRNIFIKDNLMKIGDFGISRILMGTSDMASTFTGTPYYMSPEVLKHEGYNSQSDIWSIGCIVYEMCTLEHVFSGQGIMTIMKKIVDDEPPDLPARFSDDLCDIFKRMLIKDPLKRPTAAEVLKYPFILRHIAKMHESLTDGCKAKHGTSREVADREASEIASLLREKSHLKDLQRQVSVSGQPDVILMEGQGQRPQDKKLTPREKSRLKKMREADAKAQELKNITKIQLVDNAARRQKNKASLEKTNFPDWKVDNGGAVVKQSQAVRNDSTEASASSGWQFDDNSSEDATITGLRHAPRRNSDWGPGEGYRYAGSERLTRSMSQKTTRPVPERAPKLNATFEGTYADERPIVPMRDRMVYDKEHSSLDFKHGIPDTPDLANIYYNQFDDFENDDVIVGADNDDTIRDNQEDLKYYLQVVLDKEDTEESTIVNDDAILGVYGPGAREIKITNIRAECVKLLGQQEYEKAYSYLRTARSFTPGKSEKEIMSGLRKFVQNPSDCFLVDQLLFLEDQAKLT